jgi:hypothetical protein
MERRSARKKLESMEKLVRSFKSLSLKCVTINYFFNPLGKNPLNTYFIFPFFVWMKGIREGGGDKEGRNFHN